MIDGSERDIFQLQFPRELTPVTPGVHRGDTRNEKKEWEDARFSLGKKGVNISTRMPLAPENSLRKIGHIDQTGFYPATDGPYVRRALELVTFNWRSWWQLARKLISFKARRVRVELSCTSVLQNTDYELLAWQTVTAGNKYYDAR